MTQYIKLIPTELNTEFSVDNIYSIYCYQYSPSFAYKGEVHEPWELIYIKSGRVIVETDTYSVPLSTDNIILHKPNEPHKIKADNVECLVIIFTFSTTNDALLHDIAGKILSADAWITSYINTIVYNGIDIITGKNNSYSHIGPSEFSVNFAAQQVVKNTLELLLIELKRSSNASTYSRGFSYDSTSFSNNMIVLKIVNYLNDNICKKLSLEDISNKVGYSVSSITILFKKHTGESIINYFIKLKINKACELLLKEDLSIEYISDYLNFSSTQYFCTQFKRMTGKSPLQFKKNTKKDTYYAHTQYEKV